MNYNFSIKPSLTLQDVFDYVDNALIGFETDPADSEFQEGYEHALKDLEDELIRRDPDCVGALTGSKEWLPKSDD